MRLIKAKNYFVNILNTFYLLVLLFLCLRFIFKLLGSNPDTLLIHLVYTISDQILKPLEGLVINSALDNLAYFDITTLIALIFYTLINYTLIAFLNTFINTNQQIDSFNDFKQIQVPTNLRF